MPASYRLNEPDVSAEVFDEEVLAIDLKTGHYHSLRESGVFLWQSPHGLHHLTYTGHTISLD